MDLRKRLFGKKLDQTDLQDLLEELGQPTDELITNQERWYTDKVSGRCKIRQKDEGLEYNVKIHRRDVHIVDGSLKEISMVRPLGYRVKNDKTFNYSTTVPYSNLN